VHATFCPNFVLDINSVTRYLYPVLLTEGRLPVGVGRWSRMRCPRTRPRQAGGSGDLGPRPTGNTTRVRGASLIRPPCKHDGHGGTQARTWMTEKHRGGAPRGALPCNAQGGGALAKRAGVANAATLGPLTQGPASLGVPLPLISRALCVAATWTAAVFTLAHVLVGEPATTSPGHACASYFARFHVGVAIPPPTEASPTE
jgi:hypothetical protein